MIHLDDVETIFKFIKNRFINEIYTSLENLRRFSIANNISLKRMGFILQKLKKESKIIQSKKYGWQIIP